MVSRYRLALWLALTSCGALATWRFYRIFIFEAEAGTTYAVADDVYITACFGRSLFEGHGPVWYAGAPRVEGFTSPLWTAIVGLFHVMPGFQERQLGLWVVAANVVLIAGLLWTWLGTLERARDSGGASAGRLALAALVLGGAGSLCYWAAEGFEVVLVAWIALLGLTIVARSSVSVREGAAFGLLFGLGFWARMDSVVYWASLWGLLGLHTWRSRAYAPLAAAVGAAATLVLALLLARYAYYGDWLPNTYYLKATRWPLEDRLEMGIERDASLFPAALAVWLPFVVPALRRSLGRHLAVVLACVLTFGLSVAYSVHNGGDAWKLQVGHDRYTVVGAVFLLIGLGIVIVRAPASRAWVLVTTIACVAIALDPLVRQPNWRAHVDRAIADDAPLRTLEREWIEYGARFQEISKPGATIAVCPAGAIVYFSHRGAVDLLGKVDPFVARLPATKKRPRSGHCWQNNPGHNKEDDSSTFALRNPDFSRYPPPRGFKQRYREMRYKGARFFVRDDTPFLRADAIR